MNHPILPNSSFSNFVHHLSHPLFHPPPLLPPSILSADMFLWWSHHIWCAILLNDNTDLHIPGLGTLVPEKTLMCVLCNKASSLLRSDTLSGFLLGLRVDITQTHTAHSGGSQLTHTYKYIFTPPVVCSQQLPLLHWID